MAVTSATKPELAGVIEVLERQRADGWHDGAQCYVSLGGETQLDAAVGEPAPVATCSPTT